MGQGEGLAATGEEVYDAWLGLGLGLGLGLRLGLGSGLGLGLGLGLVRRCTTPAYRNAPHMPMPACADGRMLRTWLGLGSGLGVGVGSG